MAGNSKLQKNLGNSNQTSPLPGTNYDYETFMSSPSSSRSMSGSGDGLADDEDYEGSGGDDEGSGSAGSGSGAGENFPQSKKEAVIPDLEPCRGYLFKVSVPRCLQLLSFSIRRCYLSTFQVQSLYGDDDFGPSNAVEADTKCEPTDLPVTTEMSTTPEPPIPPFSNISVSESGVNETLIGEALRDQSSICFKLLLITQTYSKVSWTQRTGVLAKVKIFDDISGDEEEADIVVPDEPEEEELLQNVEFKIMPCRLYEVSSNGFAVTTKQLRNTYIRFRCTTKWKMEIGWNSGSSRTSHGWTRMPS